MYKCLYLHKKSIREIPIYENLLHTSGLLPDVSFKYKSVTISLPNELIAGYFPDTIKEMKKHFIVTVFGLFDLFLVHMATRFVLKNYYKFNIYGGWPFVWGVNKLIPKKNNNF